MQRLLLFALEITVYLLNILFHLLRRRHTNTTYVLLYHNTIVRSFSSSKDNTVTITYVDPDGEEHPVKAEIGKHLLDTAHDNNIELEGMYIRLWVTYSLQLLLFSKDLVH